MDTFQEKAFGSIITRLIRRQDLSRNEAREAFRLICEDRPTRMQQGAFLAALAAKGETSDEVAGSWEAIYQLDTTKVSISDGLPVVENSGTGMDTVKTFNISTAASIVAAAAGIPMARHGARAITSSCGTVDMAESLGVDVECSASLVAGSIERAGIGLFNGMSPEIHPKALGRILSQIHFGSTLNIAASLANPALPRLGVRGVFSRQMIDPVIRVMKAIGYRRALVLFGGLAGSDRGMDEASLCGTTWCSELLEDGSITEFELSPERFGMATVDAPVLAPDLDPAAESKRFVNLIQGRQNGPRKEAVLLNAGLVIYVGGRAATIEEGIEKAAVALEKGNAFDTLAGWVAAQNRDPETGLKTLERLS